MKYLREHRAPRNSFRTGLPKQDRSFFDSVLESNNVYKFNYLIAGFLLNRYRRRSVGNSIADFCQSILRSYTSLEADDPDQSLVALWSLYRSLRRLTYLALDSHYAPVPFSLDLASIFFSLEHFLGDVFVEASAFQDALQRLEDVMRDTVYMNAHVLVNHARVSDEVLEGLEAASPEPNTISMLWNMMGPKKSVGRYFETPEPPSEHILEYGSMVQLSYELDPALGTRILSDPIEWERSSRAAVGLRSCRFAADFDPRRRHLKVTAALVRGATTTVLKKAALRVGKQLVDFEDRIEKLEVKLSAASTTRNGLSLLQFLLSNVLGSQKRFRLRTMPAVETSPVVRVYGSTKAADVVGTYGKWAQTSKLFHADALNEIEQLETALRSIDYRGALVAFAGSTEVIENEGLVAEFDGLVILLSRDVRQPTVVVVEAKNTHGGHREAEQELENKMWRLGIPANQFEVSHLGTKGAYAALTIG